MEEMLWQARQRSRLLQELRDGIAFAWQDQASRHVNDRYLRPHAEKDANLLGSLTLQFEELQDAQEVIKEVDELVTRCSEFMSTTEELLGFAKRDLRGSYDAVARSREYYGEAKAQFAVIQELLDRAISVCR